MFRSAKALDRAQTHSSFRQAMASYEKTAENWFDGTVDAVDRRIAHVDRLLHHIRATVARLDFADSTSQLRAAQALSADRKDLVEFKRTLLTGAADYSTWNRTASPEGLPGPNFGPDAMQRIREETPPVSGRHHNFNTAPEQFGNHAIPQLTDVTHYPGVRPSMSTRPGLPDKDPKHMRAEAALDGLPSADKRWVHLESSRFVAANTDCLSDPEELATRAQHHAALKTSTFSRPHSAAVTRAFVSSVVELGRRQYRPPVVNRTAAVYEDFDPQAMFL